MKLYLIQHAIALPETEDPKKGLSKKGVVQTQKMAGFFRMQDLTVNIIWHSKKLRSAQTAQIISKYISDAQVVERDDLNPQDPVDKFAREIEASNKDMMVVGHLPFLQKLAGRLLADSARTELITFRNSGLLCLEYGDSWKISWMVDPGLFFNS